jgi:Flp pilus assembly protein TadD
VVKFDVQLGVQLGMQLDLKFGVQWGMQWGVQWGDSHKPGFPMGPFGKPARSELLARVLWGTALIAVGAFLVLARPALGLSAADYRQLGLGHRQQGRYPEAIAAFQQAVALDPTHPSSHVLLGWTQHLAKQPTQAAATLQSALQLNPFQVETANALGIVYLVGGDLLAAVTTHGWATLLKPQNEISYYNLSLAFHRLGQQDWAIAAAQAAAQLEPQNPHPLIAQAIAQWSNGDATLAQQAYRQAQALNPGFADPGFLQEDLTYAAFTPEQIQLVQAIARP